MRNFFIYIAVLTISSAVVFLLVFSLGRSPSLEQEMARRAYRQRGDQALSISALKSAEVEESEVIEELPPPEVVSLTENVTVARSPLEEGGVVLLLDPELLSSGSGGNVPPHADFRRGLKSFFRKMPSSFRIGLRALAGEEEGDCGSTVELQPLGAWPPGELAAAGSRALELIGGCLNIVANGDVCGSHVPIIRGKCKNRKNRGQTLVFSPQVQSPEHFREKTKV